MNPTEELAQAFSEHSYPHALLDMWDDKDDGSLESLSSDLRSVLMDWLEADEQITHLLGSARSPE